MGRLRGVLAGQEHVAILDLSHLTPRLWQAAQLFELEGSQEVEAFVRQRLPWVLQGDVLLVVHGPRQMGTKRQLAQAKRMSLQRLFGYAAGYPIASGVIKAHPHQTYRGTSGLVAIRL